MPFSGRWPNSGTMQSGQVFEHQTSVPPTSEIASSSSPDPQAVKVFIPTPTASDAKGPSPGHQGTTAEAIRDLLPTPTVNDRRTDWGKYAPAVAHWEYLTCPAPEPRDVKGRLNPVFVEWMMGLPEGWVTGTRISYSAQLRALGNGVVPRQAATALRVLLG